MPVIFEGLSAPELGRSIGQWVKEHTIAVAERVLQEEVRRGFDSQLVVVTDGMPRRDYLQVRPFGRIEFVARIRTAFRMRRFAAEARSVRITSTAPMGGGHDEAGLWVESVALAYELYNVG